MVTRFTVPAKDSGAIVHCVEPDGSYGNTFMGGIEAQVIEGGTGADKGPVGGAGGGTGISVKLDAGPRSDAAVGRPVRVVLWIEQDAPPGKPKGIVDLLNNTLSQQLKQNLRWLTSHVRIASLGDKAPLQDLQVKNL